MKIEKVEKLVADLNYKAEFVIHKRNLKQIDINTDIRRNAKNDSEENFFKLMNNTVFGKAVENKIKHRDIKLFIKERRRNYLVSVPNYYTTKFLTEKLLAI